MLNKNISSELLEEVIKALSDPCDGDSSANKQHFNIILKLLNHFPKLQSYKVIDLLFKTYAGSLSWWPNECRKLATLLPKSQKNKKLEFLLRKFIEKGHAGNIEKTVKLLKRDLTEKELLRWHKVCTKKNDTGMWTGTIKYINSKISKLSA